MSDASKESNPLIEPEKWENTTLTSSQVLELVLRKGLGPNLRTATYVSKSGVVEQKYLEFKIPAAKRHKETGQIYLDPKIRVFANLFWNAERIVEMAPYVKKTGSVETEEEKKKAADSFESGQTKRPTLSARLDNSEDGKKEIEAFDEIINWIEDELAQNDKMDRWQDRKTKELRVTMDNPMYKNEKNGSASLSFRTFMPDPKNKYYPICTIFNAENEKLVVSPPPMDRNSINKDYQKIFSLTPEETYRFIHNIVQNTRCNFTMRFGRIYYHQKKYSFRPTFETFQILEVLDNQSSTIMPSLRPQDSIYRAKLSETKGLLERRIEMSVKVEQTEDASNNNEEVSSEQLKQEEGEGTFHEPEPPVLEEQ